FQKSGEEICSSVSASFFLCAGASKIPPHGQGLVAQGLVLTFKFVEGHGYEFSVTQAGGSKTKVSRSLTVASPLAAVPAGGLACRRFAPGSCRSRWRLPRLRECGRRRSGPGAPSR